MPLTQAVYNVGLTPTTVVAPTNDYVKYSLKNLQPAVVLEYARDGYIYLLGREFTISNGATVSFSITTGAYGAQFDFYSIISDRSNVFAELIEGATIVTTGSPIPAYNLNRNFSDAHTSVFRAATSVTGGTTVSSEFVSATNQSAGSLASDKIHTLKANTQYAMKFTNLSATTLVYFQLGFSEHYNGLNEIWLGTLNNSYVLKAGDELIMELPPLTTINAVSKIDSNKLAVMRLE
jgi:hypothetical protein